jgi:NADPH-dependent 2,4-dienoyl-CoA reductase/sulfur reductase-like enzyme
VLGHERVWAGGDCVEVLNLVSGQYEHVPLGTHANKHGRVIGHNVAGSYATFPGVVGTAVSKVYNLEIARTGLRERDAAHAGFGSRARRPLRRTERWTSCPGDDRVQLSALRPLCAVFVAPSSACTQVNIDLAGAGQAEHQHD